ncbi:MAG: hypothetical protein VKN72_01655 [Nostocales cyanobacterium 94392]|nr:hypothetical protein [Nostocales cyanobacterium 94392]
MAYLTFTSKELDYISAKARIVERCYENDYIPQYLKATEIATYINHLCKRGDSCSARMVNEALLRCFGDTTLDENNNWEIPQIVPPILYQKPHTKGNPSSVYKWHKILIRVIDDQIFGNQNPLLLAEKILDLTQQTSSMN